jgi:cardiolipin synthase
MPVWHDVYFLSEWAVRILMLFYVPQRRSANAARAWLLLIFLLPLPGVILYGMIGRPKLPRRRVARQAEISALLREEQARIVPATVATPDLPPHFGHVVDLGRNLGDFHTLGGNGLELIDDYTAAIDRLVADIDAATHHVHLLYYIYADDPTGRRVAEALLRATARGVSCRLMMDGMGSKRALRTLATRLRAAGVEVVAVLPTRIIRRLHSARRDLRNHRKIAVIDGHVGYTGSQNIIDRDFKPPLVYEEVVARATGPVVAQLQAVVLADRLFETEEPIRHPLMFPDPVTSGSVIAQLLPSGPGYPHENNQRFVVALLHAATTRVVITSPYFIPDGPFLQAMTTAVLRGVEVHLVVTDQIDQYLVGLGPRSFYDELLEGGVRIHSYTKRFLHAKHVTFDDAIALVGSSNMDIRSFALNAEVMLIAYDRGVVAHLRMIEERYFADAREITLSDWRRRPALHKMLQNMARLADSLL